MAQVTLRVNRDWGHFTIDPTTLILHPDATIQWVVEVVENNQIVEDSDPIYAIQFTGQTPLQEGHMIRGSAKSRAAAQPLTVNSGRYEYAATVAEGRNVFIHTSGEILVDPGGEN
jgi:hypothetical protein